MTDAIHSIAAAAIDAPGCSAYTYLLRSYQPFLREPYLQFSEFGPVKLTATAYDFLAGVGCFMQEFLYGFSGFRPQVDAVRLDPSLPPQLPGITLSDLEWLGRTLTMHIGPRESSITLNSGAVMPLITPRGAKTARLGTPLIIPTRRPDLQPTEDLVRCQQISVTSSVPGSPAVAAVDGSPATAWTAAEPAAKLTVALAAPTTLGTIKVLRGSRDLFHARSKHPPTALIGRRLPMRRQIPLRESMNSTLRRSRRNLCASSFLVLATRSPAASLS